MDDKFMTLGGYQEPFVCIGIPGVAGHYGTLGSAKNYIEVRPFGTDGKVICIRTSSRREVHTVFVALDEDQQKNFEKHVGLVEANHRYQSVMPCAVCGYPTPMCGTQRCDNCYEVESRLNVYLQSSKGRDNLFKQLLKFRPQPSSRSGTYIGTEERYKGRHACLVLHESYCHAQFDDGPLWESHSQLTFPLSDWKLDEN